MKKAFSPLPCLLLWVMVLQAQPAGPRLIVRGDDMGFSHSGNEALIKTYTAGIVTAIEVIVPSPWFPEAIQLLRENPGVDVGVHLALTSEWDNVKWRPLTACPSLTDSNGYFYPMVYPNPNYPGQAIVQHAWRLPEVEKEFRAQIELALKNLPRISHISAHMGCTDLSDSVKTLTRKLAREYKIDIDLESYQVQWVGYAGPSKTAEEKLASFQNMLRQLAPGKTYWFIDHPGMDGAELRAIHHRGYEQVAADRQGVTDLFTSAAVKALIRELGIQLISYRDLLKG